MLRKLIVSSLLLTAALTLFSCRNKNNPPVTLVMAEVNPPDSMVGQMDTAFKNRVEELSDGAIRVEIQFSGILGDEPQIMNMITSPESPVQLARVSANLSSYGGKKSKLLTVPYTFNDDSHFWRFVDSDLAKEILVEPYELGLGLRGLFYAEEGFRHFFSTSPITSLDDLKGKKIRASNSKLLQDLIKSLGAVPININYTELYMALQTGRVSIAEQPLSNYLTNTFSTIAPYLILDGHMLGAVQMVINAHTWDSLTEKQQQILQKAGIYASSVCRNLVKKSESELMDFLIANGVNATLVTDKTPWQEKCAPMIADYTSEYPDLYRKIRELGDAGFSK